MSQGLPVQGDISDWLRPNDTANGRDRQASWPTILRFQLHIWPLSPRSGRL